MRKPPFPGTMPNERPLHAKPAAVGPPRLLWPSIAYTNAGVSSKDASHFPASSDVRARHEECIRLRDRLQGVDGLPNNAMKLAAFEEAVMEARQRVLVLDPHFDDVGVHALREALDYSQVVEVRFLTQAAGDTTPWRQELERRINLNRTDRREVEVQWRKWKRGSFPFLHDRFAIVDDALWHFGATVGGGHAGVNAASGPWSAFDARAIDFFDECWRICDA